MGDHWKFSSKDFNLNIVYTIQTEGKESIGECIHIDDYKIRLRNSCILDFFYKDIQKIDILGDILPHKFEMNEYYYIEEYDGNVQIGLCVYKNEHIISISGNEINYCDIRLYKKYDNIEEYNSEKKHNTTVKGVSKDEPIVTNNQGGKQSKSLYRLDLVPPLALLKVGEELSKGLEHYPPDNWKLISVEDHLNHALIHLYAWIAGDKSDDHLSHATCRLLFATDIEEKNKQ